MAIILCSTAQNYLLNFGRGHYILAKICLHMTYIHHIGCFRQGNSRAFSSNFGKRPLAKIGKKIDLTSKLEEINGTEHNKGSKIYPQNQVTLDCIKPSIPLKHKCLSIILIWVIVSYK